MRCDELRERLVEWWDRGSVSDETFDAGDWLEIEGHLAACVECGSAARDLEGLWTRLGDLPEAESSGGARARFDDMVEAYRAGERRAIRPRTGWLEHFDRSLEPFVPRRPALQLAAALVLMAAGVVAGARFASDDPASSEPPAAANREESDELSALSTEVRELRNLVAISLLRQPSPSERLRGVSFSSRLSEPQPDVLEALIGALDHDPNVNVRLAAIEALVHFTDRDFIRESLLRSLPDQESPLVQIALIDLMVELQETGSVELLRTLAAEPEIHPAVRQRAAWGADQIG